MSSGREPGLSKKAIQSFLDFITERDATNSPVYFDGFCLTGFRLTGIEPGRCNGTLLVSPELQNRYETLHGGCIATIVDTVGTLAILTTGSRSGVSVNISVNYLSPMPGGKEAEIEATVVKAGKTLSTARVDIRNKATGQLVASGTHTKFLEVCDPTLLATAPRSKL